MSPACGEPAEPSNGLRFTMREEAIGETRGGGDGEGEPNRSYVVIVKA